MSTATQVDMQNIKTVDELILYMANLQGSKEKKQVIFAVVGAFLSNVWYHRNKVVWENARFNENTLILETINGLRMQFSSIEARRPSFGKWRLFFRC